VIRTVRRENAFAGAWLILVGGRYRDWTARVRLPVRSIERRWNIGSTRVPSTIHHPGLWRGAARFTLLLAPRHEAPAAPQRNNPPPRAETSGQRVRAAAIRLKRAVRTTRPRRGLRVLPPAADPGPPPRRELGDHQYASESRTASSSCGKAASSSLDGKPGSLAQRATMPPPHPLVHPKQETGTAPSPAITR
jgi:hypothetical protein